MNKNVILLIYNLKNKNSKKIKFDKEDLEKFNLLLKEFNIEIFFLVSHYILNSFQSNTIIASQEYELEDFIYNNIRDNSILKIDILKNLISVFKIKETYRILKGDT